ncbi:EcsC family protein [Serinicoccus sp. LYQ131]|uniref:EcsC family protein n=1 Tax=Serinicoccus sp. LYQ131 TaxID=3378797 RepID=UPI003854B735
MNTPAEDDQQGMLDGVATSFVGRLLDFGVDGVGPFTSAGQVVTAARKDHGSDVENAIDAIVKDHVRKAAAGGFATGLGGIFTMPVALPANVLGFYTLAARMVASIAELRGYDVSTKGARAAVVLCLVGADADDLLQKAGLSTAAGLTGSGRLARLATTRLPRAAAMMVNKAVGFRLLTAVGGRALGRVIRFVPIAGGVIGAGLDGFLMKRIADHARSEFVAQAAEQGQALTEGTQQP